MGTESQVQGSVEDKVSAIGAEIREIETELARVQAQKLESQRRLTALTAEYNELRLDRGKALANGESADAITKRLRKIAEDREAAEDAIAALSPLIPDLVERRRVLAAERKTAALEVNRAALRAAARRYNEKAAELVPVLHTLWTCREAANEGGTGRVAAAPAGWEGALSFVPRIYIDVDGPPLSEVRHSNFFHADAKSFIADTAKRRRAEIEAQQAAAAGTADDGE